MLMRIYIYMYAHMYIYIYMYTCIHICKSILSMYQGEKDQPSSEWSDHWMGCSFRDGSKPMIQHMGDEHP